MYRYICIHIHIYIHICIFVFFHSSRPLPFGERDVNLIALPRAVARDKGRTAQ